MEKRDRRYLCEFEIMPHGGGKKKRVRGNFYGQTAAEALTDGRRHIEKYEGKVLPGGKAWYQSAKSSVKERGHDVPLTSRYSEPDY